jgi:2-polyprenyl-3-methyl-5-hydroxy-6-metoxy-1,4-benzoquinol methylase
MLELPESELYEEELRYMPYRDSIKRVVDYICANSPEGSSMLDMMCGPGYLLGKVFERRKDMELKGVDIDDRYITYSSRKYPDINFEVGDILFWDARTQYEAVVCTGALHHIQYEYQKTAVERMSRMVKPGGFAIISDCYIDDYADEPQRRYAARKLGLEYMKDTALNGAPDHIIDGTIKIMENDIAMKEFKTSLSKRIPILKGIFREVDTLKVWPSVQSQYGDYISICRL